MKSAVMVGDVMSNCFHAAELVDIRYGDTVVVIGIGPIVLLLQCTIFGAGRFFAIGTRKNCVKLALKYVSADIVSHKDGFLLIL